MANEDSIRQISDDLIRKLIKSPITPETPQKAFIVFCEETTDILRSKVLQSLPNEEVIVSSAIIEKTKEVSSSKAIVLVAPSVDLAAKITNLQTDCPTAALVVKALFANKRVIVVTLGALAATENLRVGLRKAVEDLRCKLVEMGVEFVSTADLAQTLDSPALEPQFNESTIEKINKESTKGLSQNPNIVSLESVVAATAASANPLNSTPAVTYSLPVIVYPISQHPSQIKLGAKEEISDFVDFLQTKQCTMEKGKPCDRCDICNTLGF